MLCDRCDLAYKCDTNCMDGIGPSKAKIMLVGECPSYSDDTEGEPFVGDGGSKLNYLLEKAGIDRDDVYITFAVKCKAFRPSDIGKKSIDQCQSHLIKEVLSVRPKVIVAMGKAPVVSLLQENTVKDFRGHFQEIDIDYKHKNKERTFTTQVIPTWSPVSALTKWEFDDYIIHDLKKAKEFIKTGKVKQLPIPEYKLVLTKKDLEEFEEYYSNVDSFNTDLETTGLLFHQSDIINSGFADSKKFATIVPMLEYTDEHMKKWDEEDKKLGKKINKFVRKYKKRIYSAVKRVHASPAKKILHNGKFDAKFAMNKKIPYTNFYYDTIIGNSLIDENKDGYLNTCMEFEGINYGAYDTDLWIHVNKTKKKSYQFIPPRKICEYLAIDVCGDRRLYLKQKKKLKKEGMWNLMMERQMPLSRMMSEVEYTGVKFDKERLKEISRLFEAKIIDIESKVRKLTKIKDLNLNSSDQLREYFEDHDYPFEEMVIKRGKKGYSCGEEALKKFTRKRKYKKIPELILDHRALVKMKNTFLDGKEGDGGLLKFIDDKNRIHANWNIHTPRTGRLSCNSPNLQQIPRPNPNTPDANIRQLFIPTKKKWVLFSADFAQLELRVGAHMSGDKTMIKEIQEGVELHTRNAVKFGVTLGFLPEDMTEERFAEIRNYKPPKNWKKKYKTNKKKYKSIKKKIHLQGVYDEHRVFAKTLGFGLNYGMDANTLAQQFSMDVEDVQDMIDIYFEKYHILHAWRQDMMDKSIEEGVLILPETGRKRRFKQAADWFNSDHAQDCRKREWDISSVHRQAMNFPIQGYANEIYTKGKLELNKEMRRRNMKSRILLSIHDGLIGEGPKEEMAIINELVEKYMVTSLGKGKKKVPLNVDFELYDCWYGKKMTLEDLGIKNGNKKTKKAA